MTAPQDQQTIKQKENRKKNKIWMKNQQKQQKEQRCTTTNGVLELTLWNIVNLLYKTNNLDNTLLIFRLNYIKHLVYALRLQPLQQLSFYFPDFDYFYFTSSTRPPRKCNTNGISIMSKILFLITALTTVQAVTYVNFSFLHWYSF